MPSLVIFRLVSGQILPPDSIYQGFLFKEILTGANAITNIVAVEPSAGHL
jgi:hypothetical protein